MNPVVSIIVPCYNQAPYLSEALQSVLDQTYSEWECIIVNDGSTDDSEKIAKEWAKKDSRFTYCYKDNSGVSDTRNFGIRQAKGIYILPLDADDKIDSLYLEKGLEVFKENPATKLVYSNYIQFGAKNVESKTPDYEYENMFLKNQIFNAAIFKKEDFLQTDGYNPNMIDGLEDWDFWLGFIKKDDIVVKLSGFHFYYRIKEVSRSTLIDKEKNERLLLQIFRNHTSLFLEHFNPMRDHIEAVQFKKEVVWLKEQPEYRIGRVVYAPFKLMKKVFRRIFGG